MGRQLVDAAHNHSCPAWEWHRQFELKHTHTHTHTRTGVCPFLCMCVCAPRCVRAQVQMCACTHAQDVVEVLITMGALEAGTLRVLPLGLVARNIQVGLQCV